MDFLMRKVLKISEGRESLPELMHHSGKNLGPMSTNLVKVGLHTSSLVRGQLGLLLPHLSPSAELLNQSLVVGEWPMS